MCQTLRLNIIIPVYVLKFSSKKKLEKEKLKEKVHYLRSF